MALLVRNCLPVHELRLTPGPRSPTVRAHISQATSSDTKCHLLMSATSHSGKVHASVDGKTMLCSMRVIKTPLSSPQRLVAQCGVIARGRCGRAAQAWAEYTLGVFIATRTIHDKLAILVVICDF